MRKMLITGAGGGIGRASVDYFAERGWQVIGVDIAPYGDGFPENGLFIQGNIADPKEIEIIFEKVKTFTNDLNAIINNAAIQYAKPILETTVDEWDELMGVNLRAVFLGVLTGVTSQIS